MKDHDVLFVLSALCGVVALLLGFKSKSKKIKKICAIGALGCAAAAVYSKHKLIEKD